MRPLRLFPSLLCAVFFLSIPGAGQTVSFNQRAEERFLIGMKQFSRSEYKFAYASFQHVVEDYVLNQRTTAAIMMSAKALFRLGKFNETIIILNDFLEQYPKSTYIEDAHYTLGTAHYSLRRFPDAARDMLSVLRSGKEKKTFLRAQTILNNVCTEFLSVRELNDILRSVSNDSDRAVLTMYLAENEYEQKANAEALAHARDVVAHGGLPFVIQRAYALIARIEKKGPLKIGLLLPLMANSAIPARRLGTEILDGIQYAANEFNAESGLHGNTIILDIRDTERDTAVALREIDSLLQDTTMVAVIGPVFSNEVIAVAKKAGAARVGLITPTATDTGIASVDKYIFQANPDLAMRGKAMAQYAVKKLEFKNLAVISPDAPASKLLASAFVTEALRLGATIVSDKRYFKGSLDLRHLFRAMRAEAMALESDSYISFVGKLTYADIIKKLSAAGVNIGVVDSLLEADGQVSVMRVWGSEGKKIVDSLGIPTRQESSLVDSLQYPTKGIQGLFCPILSSNEIGVITSQAAFFNIKTQILGSGEWNDMDELYQNRRYAEGVIFPSDRWVDPTPVYDAFASRFAKAYGYQPNDNVLFGYDTMSLLETLMMSGAVTRAALAASISNVSGFQGFHSKISFTESRVNSHLHILQFRRGKISKIDEFQYQMN